MIDPRELNLNFTLDDLKALMQSAPQIGQALAGYNSNPFGSLSAGTTVQSGGQTYAQQPNGRFVNQRFVGMGGLINVSS